MSDNYANLKIKSIKEQKDIPILKHIPVCMIDKYWIDVVADQYDVLELGFEIKDVDNITVATVIEIIDNTALLQLSQQINFFEAIQFGITMDRIVFDQPQQWLNCSDIDLNQQITI